MRAQESRVTAAVESPAPARLAGRAALPLSLSWRYLVSSNLPQARDLGSEVMRERHVLHFDLRHDLAVHQGDKTIMCRTVRHDQHPAWRFCERQEIQRTRTRVQLPSVHGASRLDLGDDRSICRYRVELMHSARAKRESCLRERDSLPLAQHVPDMLLYDGGQVARVSHPMKVPVLALVLVLVVERLVNQLLALDLSAIRLNDK
jgi:hypothetical protein